jgi:hypothetical protein
MELITKEKEQQNGNITEFKKWLQADADAYLFIKWLQKNGYKI